MLCVHWKHDEHGKIPWSSGVCSPDTEQDIGVRQSAGLGCSTHTCDTLRHREKKVLCQSGAWESLVCLGDGFLPEKSNLDMDPGVNLQKRKVSADGVDREWVAQKASHLLHLACDEVSEDSSKSLFHRLAQIPRMNGWVSIPLKVVISCH